MPAIAVLGGDDEEEVAALVAEMLSKDGHEVVDDAVGHRDLDRIAELLLQPVRRAVGAGGDDRMQARRVEGFGRMQPAGAKPIGPVRRVEGVSQGMGDAIR